MSAAQEPRWALGPDGRQRFLVIVRHERDQFVTDREVERCVQSLFDQLVDRCLCVLERQRGPGRERSASFRASDCSSSAGTTRLTRPIRSASVAESESPVNKYCFALAGPTNRGQMAVPPSPATIATLTCGSAMVAVSAIMIPSHSSAIVAPKPTAGPLMAATSGISMSTRSQIRCLAGRGVVRDCRGSGTRSSPLRQRRLSRGRSAPPPWHRPQHEAIRTAR